jgi:hypothetical protein
MIRVAGLTVAFRENTDDFYISVQVFATVVNHSFDLLKMKFGRSCNNTIPIERDAEIRSDVYVFLSDFR